MGSSDTKNNKKDVKKKKKIKVIEDSSDESDESIIMQTTGRKTKSVEKVVNGNREGRNGVVDKMMKSKVTNGIANEKKIKKR